MSITDRDFLSAEETEIKALLDSLPSGSVLEQRSLEARLHEVRAVLGSMRSQEYAPARARLTFRGRPVVGSRGIFVDFGTKATNAFCDAVAKIAASISGPLASMGPLPKGDESQLMITSTAIGSFGFELEEFRPCQLPFDEPSDSGHALELARNFLQSTLDSDEELADAAAGTDPRAVDAVRSFLDILAANEAVCSLEFNNKMFRFNDVGDVRRSMQRIARENLSEKSAILSGEFQGILPKARTFEFKLTQSNDVVRGKIAPSVVDPDLINQHLHQAVTIDVLETRVGSGRPRYLLKSLPNWPEG